MNTRTARIFLLSALAGSLAMAFSLSFASEPEPTLATIPPVAQARR